jgi:hypothetical protein
MRGRSRLFSTCVAVCLGLIGGAGAGGLYLGFSARDGFGPEAASRVVVDLAPSDAVNLRFPADWTEVAATDSTPKMLAFASADGAMTLFSPRPIYPLMPAAEAEPPAAKTAASAAQSHSSAKITLASTTSKPANVAPKPRSNAVLNDSQIASIKRRLALTPDQERYWPAVEAELRKMEYTKTADKKSTQGTRMASIDMSKMDVEGLKSAGFPLVMSFSDDQRRELKSLAHLLGLESVMSGI